MKKQVMAVMLLAITALSCAAQKADPYFTRGEAERIEQFLAADGMRGRKTFSPEIDRAADFISAEFKAAGLEPLGKSRSFLQDFVMVSVKQTAISCTLDGREADTKNIQVITCLPSLEVTEKSGYEVIKMESGLNFMQEAQKYIRSGKNYVVVADDSYARNFSRLAYFRRQQFKTDNSVIFIMAADKPQQFSVKVTNEVNEQKLANVVGVLPGKSRKDEYVIFSGHYDHLGTGKPVAGDSIYNGANDDAAGTTAVIMLARYFKAMGNNERTLVFAAFTAEEIGGFGSQYFSRQFNPDQVVAMFNLEMIGTESKWGKNSAYITGYEKTDMGAILQKNLEGTGFTFYPDPYPDQQLFYRSDNATLARLGVPAHTISTSKMDSEPNYHKVSDEVGTLDLDNMTMIIKAIALSSKGIVSGKDTPARVNTGDLR